MRRLGATLQRRRSAVDSCDHQWRTGPSDVRVARFLAAGTRTDACAYSLPELRSASVHGDICARIETGAYSSLPHQHCATCVAALTTGSCAYRFLHRHSNGANALCHSYLDIACRVERAPEWRMVARGSCSCKQRWSESRSRGFRESHVAVEQLGTCGDKDVAAWLEAWKPVDRGEPRPAGFVVCALHQRAAGGSPHRKGVR